MAHVSGRALLGLYFFVPGLSKVFSFEATSTYMAEHDVPLIPVALVVTILLQLGGGVSLMIGYRTQLVAAVLAALTLVINIFMHNFWVMEDGMERAHEMQNFIKNLAIMAGLLALAGSTKAGSHQ